MGGVLVVVSEFGLGQEGAKFHGLLWGTLEVARQEGLFNVQEKDMPAKERRESLRLGITVSEVACGAGVRLKARAIAQRTVCARPWVLSPVRQKTTKRAQPALQFHNRALSIFKQ